MKVKKIILLTLPPIFLVRPSSLLPWVSPCLSTSTSSSFNQIHHCTAKMLGRLIILLHLSLRLWSFRRWFLRFVRHYLFIHIHPLRGLFKLLNDVVGVIHLDVLVLRSSSFIADSSTLRTDAADAETWDFRLMIRLLSVVFIDFDLFQAQLTPILELWRENSESIVICPVG